MELKSLVKKYNVPGPRYTSYPTVPYWKNDLLSEKQWVNVLNQVTNETIAIYIHLPFCEDLCTFCGCHKRITKNHSIEGPYVDAVLNEWRLYKQHLPSNLQISEIHLGGGTPTFFSPAQLKRLLIGITEGINTTSCSMGFEAHPNNTTEEHLYTLHSLGFKRISFGIQDYNPRVQQAIHRIQTENQVRNIHEKAKKIGYSINHDLVYGLPFQDLAALTNTLEITTSMRPDRIALYSYAHVPWVKGTGQRGYQEADLPNEVVKMDCYEFATNFLTEQGYIPIGMDHFALPHDELAIALNDGKLHRNFMGYTVQTSKTMIGLGMSAISDAWYGFAQNHKHLETYMEHVNRGEIPVFKGHILSKKDLEIRAKILELMCHFTTQLPSNDQERAQVMAGLNPLEADGIIKIKQDFVSIQPAYRGFVRNVCMCFDEYLRSQPKKENTFSKTI